MPEGHGYDLGAIETDWLDAEAVAEQEAEHSLREHVERIAETASIGYGDARAYFNTNRRAA